MDSKHTTDFALVWSIMRGIADSVETEKAYFDAIHSELCQISPPGKGGVGIANGRRVARLMVLAHEIQAEYRKDVLRTGVEL